MSAQQVVFQYLSAGSNTLTVPPGFSSQVLVYAWGAGGGSGYNSPAGGGGGFVQGIITVSSGDTVVISVGGQGGVGPRDGSGLGGIGDTPAISFNGGTTGVAAPYPGPDDQFYGAGGGGGAATAVLVNGIPMIVAAGGGGGGGGTSYQTGTPGLAGGVTTLASTTPRGGSSTGGYSVGGAGGGGYPFGGAGGDTVGDDAGASTGGYGGQNYANASVTSSTLAAGSGITPGGLTNALYPKAKRGYAGYDGAVIVIFTKNFRAWIKDTDWKEVNNAWVKVPDTIVTTRVESFGTPVTRTFTTLGTSNWTVPDDVTSVRVTYPTTTGLVSTTQSVTPGQVISVTVGNYGETSTFGGITIPIFEKQVFSYIGNIDHVKNNVVQVATPTGVSYSGSGDNGTLTAGAAAVGISYTDGGPGEGWHGDLSATVSITPVKLETMLNNVQVFRSSGSGRQISNYGFAAHPAASNSYIMQDVQYDTFGGEGSYSFTTTLQQQGYIRLDFAPVIAPVYITTNTGGWKPIIQAWIKDNDQWKSIQSGVSLVPVPSTAELVTINLNIAANANNYVLSDFLSATSYYPGRSIVNLTVNAGVIVGSSSIGSPALIIDGLASGDIINLTNNGNIAGAGGGGGAAGSYSSVTSGGAKYQDSKGRPAPKGGYRAGTTTVNSVPGRPGEPGGPALYVTYQTNLVNNGTIAGGGGGGGGGGGATGGQGGGGAGRLAGSGANNGSLTAGGAGAGLGGAGGARGIAGSDGANDSNGGGLGGAPGSAITGIDKVTITTEGTIIGPQIVI
jgi:hypothetical protein